LSSEQTGVTGVPSLLRLLSFVVAEPKKRQCRALFEYVPQNEDELELKIGDIIDINEEVRLVLRYTALH
jgi:hypothetical protein